MFVEVKQGKLEGLSRKSVLTGKEYFAFLGIPYAKPPIGDLRFQPPEPSEKWEGTFKATQEGSPCFQRDFTGKFIGGEDCLYLNVFTPSLPSDNKTPKAVMVYIHGGAFQSASGSPDLFAPDYLINYDIILVTLNYRLHVLGFLNMGTKNNADNCGLRDQNLALKWANENIAQFGGDSENITLFGESAGAACVLFHMISPMSKGLFHKAIIQSDAVYHDLKPGHDPRQVGFALGQKLGCDETDPEKLVEFFKEQSTLDLYKGSSSIFFEVVRHRTDGVLAECFVPSVELAAENAFLPDTFENLKRKAPPLPLITGLNSKEGKLAFALFQGDLFEHLKSDFTKVVQPKTMLRKCDSLELRDLGEKIKKFYLGDDPIGEETTDQIADMFTDRWFQNFYEEFDFVTDSKAPVFVYEFAFVGKFSIFEKMMKRRLNCHGVGHADELPYLFYSEKLLRGSQEIGEPETTVIKQTCALWTNFAKTGNPTEDFTNIEWKPHNADNPYYLRIDKDLELIEGRIRQRGFEFWQSLMK